VLARLPFFCGESIDILILICDVIRYKMTPESAHMRELRSGKKCHGINNQNSCCLYCTVLRSGSLLFTWFVAIIVPPKRSKTNTMKLLPLLFLALCTTMGSANDNPACILMCHNEGKCHMGRAEFGYASEMDEEDETPYANRDPSTEMYCSCPEGFAGIDCEIVLMPCEGNTCSNGEECINTQNDNGGLYQHCECDPENTDFRAVYSTHFCRQIATSYCIAQPESSGAAGRNHFCTNGGRCKDVVAATEP
jgi:hypothetical protein